MEQHERLNNALAALQAEADQLRAAIREMHAVLDELEAGSEVIAW